MGVITTLGGKAGMGRRRLGDDEAEEMAATDNSASKKKRRVIRTYFNPSVHGPLLFLIVFRL